MRRARAFGEKPLDDRSHEVRLLRIHLAHAAQVMLVAVVLQVFGNRELRDRRCRQRVEELEFFHLVPVTTRDRPADPIRGRQALRERRTVQYEPLRVVGLEGRGMRVAEVQFVVDVAFYGWNVVPLQQFDQLALFLVGHLEPEGILEIRHHHARGDAAGVEKPGKHTNIYSFTRMRRDFDRAHSHPLDRMQHRVERRRLDGHRITRFPNRLQAEIDSLGRAERHDNLIGIHRHAVLQVPPRDLSDQLRVPRWQFVGHAPLRLAARDVVRVAVDLVEREQLRIGVRRAQRRRRLGADRTQRRQHEPAHVHVRGHRDRLRSQQLVRSLTARTVRRETNEVPGLRAAFDDALAFEQQVRVDHRRDAELVVLARLPDRRNAISVPKHAAQNLAFDVRRQSFV